MSCDLPKLSKVYQNHHINSTRWEKFSPRKDDIFIVGSFRAGTTWIQNVVRHLVLRDSNEMLPLGLYSPTLELRLQSIEHVIDALEGQKHRRCVKTHLPVNGIPYFGEAKYIVVGRDPRESFMSLWDYYRDLTDDFLILINEKLDGPVENPLLPCPLEIGSFWYQWITKGAFEWEREGYPFGSTIDHIQGWWNFRNLPNLLFVHYRDMLDSPDGEISRIAEFLEERVTNSQVESIVEQTSFASMKEEAESLQIPLSGALKAGATGFINKGVPERWNRALAPEDLSLYKDTVSRIMSPACLEWIENGSNKS